MDLSSCLLKLARAEEIAAHDCVLSSLLKLIEVFGNGICDGRLARASLAGHPEDRRAVRRNLVSPCNYLLQNLLASSWSTGFAGHCRRPAPQVSVVDRLTGEKTVKFRELKDD